MKVWATVPPSCDYEDDVAGVVVGGEVVEGAGQGRGGGDAAIGD